MMDIFHIPLTNSTMIILTHHELCEDTEVEYEETLFAVWHFPGVGCMYCDYIANSLVFNNGIICVTRGINP
jgi:hypothetical protein